MLTLEYLRAAGIAGVRCVAEGLMPVNVQAAVSRDFSHHTDALRIHGVASAWLGMTSVNREGDLPPNGRRQIRVEVHRSDGGHCRRSHTVGAVDYA